MRKTFAEISKSLLKKNSNFAIILGDISVGLFVDENEKLPKNIFNLGVLEQSMISFAAGLSRGGITPIIHTISPFMIERAYEQIKLDVSYNQCKVIMVSANGPYDYFKLGPTHHCSFDVPLINNLKNINIYTPSREKDFIKCFNQAVEINKSSYIRLTSSLANTDEIIDNEIYSSGNENKCLSIFVGEALKLSEDKSSIPGDYLYLYDFESINFKNLMGYKIINIWEPYSKPIIGLKIRNFIKENCKINSYCYPSAIENGIFSKPIYEMLSL